MSNSLFEEFQSEVQNRLPWMQLINSPNLQQKQLEQLKPPHGIFITNENLAIAGIDSDYCVKELGWKSHEQTFQDGNNVTTGLLTDNIRFCCLHKTPVVVEQEGQIIGFLFTREGGGTSEIGKLAIAEPMIYRRKSWWLIAILGKNNNIISKTPIKLSLGAAVGASLSQELAKSTEEYEIEFFRVHNQPRQGLSSRARSFFVHDWTLGSHKAPNKAPYEFVKERLGVATEIKQYLRYNNGGSRREITVIPFDFSSLIISPSSETGKIIDEWRTQYERQFFRKIDYFSQSQIKTVATNEREEYIETEEELVEDTPF